MKRTPFSQTRRHGRSTAGVILGAAAIAGVGIGALSGRSDAVGPAARSEYRAVATDCRVVDGDTLHCDGGRIRLLEIDAPELPGHCAVGRDCAPGDPYASTQSLNEGMGDGSSLKIEPVGTDRYGRTLALVMGRRGDLSCWQLERNEAIYKPTWDNDGRVRAICPTYAR